jgi:hypothetical protein
MAAADGVATALPTITRGTLRCSETMGQHDDA